MWGGEGSPPLSRGPGRRCCGRCCGWGGAWGLNLEPGGASTCSKTLTPKMKVVLSLLALGAVSARRNLRRQAETPFMQHASRFGRRYTTGELFF